MLKSCVLLVGAIAVSAVLMLSSCGTGRTGNDFPGGDRGASGDRGDHGDFYDVDPAPVNPNASGEVHELMQYLAGIYGEYTLSGQMDLTWEDSVDMIDRVYQAVGKYPALMGYDFMNYHREDLDGGSGLEQVEEAIEWWNAGGLVTFCWHWRDPSLETIAFYTDRTDFRPDLDDPEVREQILADIDLIAEDLRDLEEAGVPVLWRPLHEASGGWFWWGASGPEAFIDLWKLMIDRLQDHHELTNLIWVYNGQHPDWYPGDEYVDIIGEDPYVDPEETAAGTVHYRGSYADRFMEAALTPGEPKMVAMTENGTMPHPDSMHVDNAVWLWFKTWNDGREPEGENAFFSGEHWNPQQHKIEVYHHPRVLTLQDVARDFHGTVGPQIDNIAPAPFD